MKTNLATGFQPFLFFPLLCPTTSRLLFDKFSFVEASQKFPEKKEWGRKRIEMKTYLRASSSNVISFICSRLAFFFAAIALWDWVSSAMLLGIRWNGNAESSILLGKVLFVLMGILSNRSGRDLLESTCIMESYKTFGARGYSPCLVHYTLSLFQIPTQPHFHPITWHTKYGYSTARIATCSSQIAEWRYTILSIFYQFIITWKCLSRQSYSCDPMSPSILQTHSR